MVKGIFVTGTDTEVGKTQVTAGLAAVLNRRFASERTGIGRTKPSNPNPPASPPKPAQGQDMKRRVSLWKPVQTGVAIGSLDADSSRLLRISGLHEQETDVVSHTFPDPLAPWTAARRANAVIDFAGLVGEGRRRMRQSDFLIVEGAGGLAVPLTEKELIADLAKQLGLPLVVVARPGLGTVNHTVLTVTFALRMGIQVLGVILNGYKDAADPRLSENAEMIETFSGVPVIGKLPWFPSPAEGEADWDDWRERWANIVERQVDIHKISGLNES